MVKAVTNLGRSGLYDWLVQRLTSVILLAYFGYLAVFLVCGVDYVTWQAVFAPTWMKVFSMMALLSLVTHTWIGMWGVLTDYVTTRLMGPRGNVLRGLLQLVCGVALFTFLVWGIQILWG